MTIQDITCFLKLAENLNYTKTAEELFISQPAVTRHINSLEEELGIKLFDRSVKRKITLTESGELYHAGLLKCQKIYTDTLDSISNKIAANPIVINFSRGINIPDEFVEATADFMVLHPTFNHFTNFIESSDFTRVIENGEIVICRDEYIKNLKCKTMKLTANPVPYYLVANKKHPGLKTPDAPDFNAIRDTTLFLPKNLPDTIKEEYFTNLKSLLGAMPIEVMYLDSMDSVELFLRSGRCFTIANGWYSLLESKHHVCYQLDFASNYVAMWDPAKCVNPLAVKYLEMLKGLSL